MSRMTKYLKQTCEMLQQQRTETGDPVLNSHGEIMYNEPIIVKCRREDYFRDVQVSEGDSLQSKSRYFIDEKTEVRVNDKIDGSIVLKVTEYIGPFGERVGWEIYVL